MLAALNKFAISLILIMPAIFTLGNGAIDVALSILVLVYLVAHATNRSQLIVNKWFVAFIALWVCLIVRGLFAPDMWISLKAALPMLRFPLLALAVAYFIRNHQAAKRQLFFATSIVLIFLGFNAIVQIALGHDIFSNSLVQHEHFFRLTTPTGKQRVGYVCAFLMLPLLGYFLDILLSKRINSVSFYVIGIAVISGFTTIVLSGERMPLAITLFTLAIGLLCTHKLRRKAMVAMLIASIAVFISIAFSPQLHHRLVGTTGQQLSNFQNDAYGRIYQCAYCMFLENKLFGVGTNQFANVCPAFLEETNASEMQCATHPHNYYLQMLAEGGLLGLTLFVIAVILMLVACFKGAREYYALFATLLVLTKFLPIVPSASFYIAWSSAPIWFAVGLALSSVAPQRTA